MSSPRMLRKPPERKLDNYVASIKILNTGESPETVPDSAFQDKNYAIKAADPSVSTARVNDIPIGFDLSINEKIYKKFTAGANGYIVLADPNTPDGRDIIYDVCAGNSNLNLTPVLTQFTSYDHIFLCPLFSNYNYLFPGEAANLKVLGLYDSTLTTTILEEIESGINTKIWPFDKTDYGLRYANSYDPVKGRSLLVRFTSSNRNYTSLIKAKVETAIYENGTIEFRYWPKEEIEPGDAYPYVGPEYDNSYFVTGIFWSGANIGQNKFRDFSPMLDYRRDERVISKLGGSSYDAGFSEGAGPEPYAKFLKLSYNYPKKGAVITFSPPVNSAKILPRRIISDISSTREIVRRPGLFDDRKTFNYHTGSVIVNMPSMLPTRLMGDTSRDIDIPFRQHLFTSGGLEVAGNINKTIVDKMIGQIDAASSARSTSNFSFNESEVIINVVGSDSEFYASGSSTQLFGPGFSTALSGKTQFQLSLPVSKKVKMPEVSSSIYYYDKNRRQWSFVAPNNASIIIPSTWYLTKNNDFNVTENSFGFDAVGRKIVSGSIPEEIRRGGSPMGTLFGYKSDPYIGSVYNTPTKEPFDPGKSYEKSITDNPDYFPTEDQKLKIKNEYPFLIEKVVIDLPLSIGETHDGWFLDKTTCGRAFTNDRSTNGLVTPITGTAMGPFDFGGPGLTVSVMCARKSLNLTYMDLIASGTVTHQFDNTASIAFYRDPGMDNYFIRPIGFKSFSNPTSVISGNLDGGNYKFEGSVRLNMEASVSNGITFAREDWSIFSASISNTDADEFKASNRAAVIKSLTSPTLLIDGEKSANSYGFSMTNLAEYLDRAPRVYVQQISPLSRGTSRFELCGNSILGRQFLTIDTSKRVINPLYVAASSSLPTDIKNKIDSSNFTAVSFNMYTTNVSTPSPYLIFPEDELVISVSKTRPNVYRVYESDSLPAYIADPLSYGNYQLTGSHDICLNTGSINVTFYGCYIREGVEFNP